MAPRVLPLVRGAFANGSMKDDGGARLRVEATERRGVATVACEFVGVPAVDTGIWGDATALCSDISGASGSRSKIPAVDEVLQMGPSAGAEEIRVRRQSWQKERVAGHNAYLLLRCCQKSRPPAIQQHSYFSCFAFEKHSIRSEVATRNY